LSLEDGGVINGTLVLNGTQSAFSDAATIGYVDTKLSLDGSSTMTGPLILQLNDDSDPTNTAATKEFALGIVIGSVAITDTADDTFISMGYLDTVGTDSLTNEIRIQAGNEIIAVGSPPLSKPVGNVIIIAGQGSSTLSGDIILTGGSGAGTSQGAGNVKINGGFGSIGAPGGTVDIAGGIDVGSGSGSVNITAGDSNIPSGGGIAANVNITGGQTLSGTGVNITAGDVNIAGGQGGGIGKSGDVNVMGGTGLDTGPAGNINLTAGASTTGVSGNINLTAGASATGTSGNVIIQHNGLGITETVDLRFYDLDKSAYVALRSPNVVTGNNVSLTLPDTQGTKDQVLAVTPFTGIDSGTDYVTTSFVDQPYDLAAQAYGALADGDVILRFISTRDCVIFDIGHAAIALTAPTGTATFTIAGSVAGVLGTITFTNSTTPNTIDFTTSTDIAIGELVTITCTTASGIEDVSITLLGRVGTI